MERKKIAIINILCNISEANDFIEVAVGRVEDCGLNASEQEEVMEYLRKGIQLLDKAYDIVDHVKC